MSWRAQNRPQDAKIHSIHGTRSDCLIPGSCGIQRYQGATEKIKREIDAHLRQLAKKSTCTYVPLFFSAFFGVSRKKGHSKKIDGPRRMFD
jgi:hypothetical protein